ncbi:MAG TPA: twin-arginine translocation signal domain-containing protein, partial [Pirellula sp.]|nr:twin-arginine translocation signal domain-containing protein [Pirellula sp.]
MYQQESMPSNDASRRSFLKNSGVAATAGALASNLSRSVHAGEDNTIRVAIVGCGGRGSGAAANALSVTNGPIELVAMADVFDYKLKSCYETLSKQFPDKVKVSPDKKFVDFNGYKNAMDCLRPGDVVIMATPCAFRWVQFEYAISKGLNVFMEKPVTADGPSSRKMLELGKLSVAKNLKVGIGLMCRHCEARGELFRRIKGGEIGDVLLMRAYRMAGPTGSAATEKKPADMSELMYQINRFHGFLWASGGA